MSIDIDKLIKDKKELKEFFKDNSLNISINELIDELSKCFNYDLNHLKIKARTNVKLIGKDPEDVEELLYMLDKQNFQPVIEVLIISDYRKKHDNTLEFKYLLSIPFNKNTILEDKTLLIDSLDLKYEYDSFLEVSYLTFNIDENIIPSLIYNVNKTNFNGYISRLYSPSNYIEKVLLDKIHLLKNDSRKH